MSHTYRHQNNKPAIQPAIRHSHRYLKNQPPTTRIRTKTTTIADKRYNMSKKQKLKKKNTRKQTKIFMFVCL